MVYIHLKYDSLLKNTLVEVYQSLLFGTRCIAIQLLRRLDTEGIAYASRYSGLDGMATHICGIPLTSAT